MEGNDVLSQRTLHQPPSCIEFCPARPSMLVVGTYELNDSQTNGTTERAPSQARSGQVELYQIRRTASTSGFGISQCLDKYVLPDCAVLDLHFHPQHPTFFGVCTSTSRMIFFNLADFESNEKGESTMPSILEVGSLRMGQDSSILTTSFAWNTEPNIDDPHFMSFAATFSSGEVKLIGITRRAEAKHSGLCGVQVVFEASIDLAHNLEAWNGAFVDLSSGAKPKKLLFTGGDDSILACHSIETKLDSGPMIATQLFRDRKSHAAGVTAILPILDSSQVSPSCRAFVTGSYDEHIRVFTIEESPPHKRQVVAELHLGGGVWRLRTLSQSFSEGGGCISSVLILVSCMHAGVRIVRVARKQQIRESQNWFTWSVNIVGQFTAGHKSMCYGADSVSVSRLINTNVAAGLCMDPTHQKRPSGSRCWDDCQPQDFIMASTSFYDKKICVWNFRDDPAAPGKVGSD